MQLLLNLDKARVFLLVFLDLVPQLVILAFLGLQRLLLHVFLTKVGPHWGDIWSVLIFHVFLESARLFIIEQLFVIIGLSLADPDLMLLLVDLGTVVSGMGH